jgi:polyribonucleotide nucleotidyltransferase
VREIAEPGLRAAYETVQKEQRRERVAETRDQVVAELIPADATEAPDPLQVKAAFKAVEKEIVRGNIIETEKRIDGRSLSDVRQIICEVGVLPRTHGSALFTRGETQALVVTTLGTGEDEQYVDAWKGPTSRTSCCTTTSRRSRSAKTGASASPAGARSATASSPGGPSIPCCRARPVPLHDPRGLGDHRIERLVLDGHGVRHLAVADGRRRALRRPVAGIAMGLILEGERFAVLSDILGDEDHLGDMDFKVAGTEEGVTSLQMDIKVTGITEEIMRIALFQARDGRLGILNRMAEALTESRPGLGEYAPRIEVMRSPPTRSAR